MKYLRAHAVVSVRAITRFQTCLTLADLASLHDRVGAQLIYQIKAVFTLAEIKDYAAPGSGNLFQRGV